MRPNLERRRGLGGCKFFSPTLNASPFARATHTRAPRRLRSLREDRVRGHRVIRQPRLNRRHGMAHDRHPRAPKRRRAIVGTRDRKTTPVKSVIDLRIRESDTQNDGAPPRAHLARKSQCMQDDCALSSPSLSRALHSRVRAFTPTYTYIRVRRHVGGHGVVVI